MNDSQILALQRKAARNAMKALRMEQLQEKQLRAQLDRIVGSRNPVDAKRYVVLADQMRAVNARRTVLEKALADAFIQR